MMASPRGFEEPSVSKSDVGDAGAIAKLRQRRRDANLSLALIRLQQAQRARAPVFRPVKRKAPRDGLINSPQMRDTTASCRGFIHAA
ncbi:hypothetical protein KWH04_23100, partial [Xanthomonas campestris pv. trichodesmae]|nr:hypothetical protein [Xanthomonas campestris pv. trichodesmae]